MTISKKKDHTIKDTPGPGHYNEEKAESLTRVSSPRHTFAKSSVRHSFVNPGSPAGPGDYEENKAYNSNIKPITIKIKRKPKQQPEIDLGPSTYKPENADALTRVKSSFA